MLPPLIYIYKTMVKVYGIAGRTCANITLAVGKATLQIEFTKGCLDRKNYRPATYSTGDAVVQKMIEDSSLFGSLIKIYRAYGNDAPVEEKKVEGKSYPEVTTLEGVIATLKANGAKATVLNSEANMQKFMLAKGITFPNYNF